MIIRSMREDDIDQLMRIHEKFYRNEFNFPDFLRHFLCAFVVIDNNERIITGGGVRTIAESILITDLDRHTRERMKALFKVLNASVFIARKSNYDQIHAFIQGDWKKHLKKVGFNPAKGEALVLGL